MWNVHSLGTSILNKFLFKTWIFLKSRPLYFRKTWYKYKTHLCSSRMSFKISMKFAAKCQENFTYGLKKLLEIVTNTTYKDAKEYSILLYYQWKGLHLLCKGPQLESSICHQDVAKRTLTQDFLDAKIWHWHHYPVPTVTLHCRSTNHYHTYIDKTFQAWYLQLRFSVLNAYQLKD